MVVKEVFMADIITISYEELVAGVDLSEKIEAGFGPSGLGIVSVSGVPNYKELRKRLLPIATEVASLPDGAKKKLEDPVSRYSFGWSHGKEMMIKGVPDDRKGSYYANPIYDVPTTDNELIAKYPGYCRPNLWPGDELPVLEQAFKDLGQLIVEIGLQLTKHCDSYIKSKNPEFIEGKLLDVLRRSRNYKGRLLHYFPPPRSDLKLETKQLPISSWCGWHSDLGSLTGLTSAMYMKGNKEVTNPDPNSGLHIRDRHGSVIKANLVPDHIGYQMGQAMQIHSGGLLLATPHCVRAAEGEGAFGVARNTFALFMQPSWDEPLDLPPHVSPRAMDVDKWEANIPFGKFAENVLSKHYEATAGI